MEEQGKYPKKETAVITETKMGVGVKVLLTVIVLSAVVGGVFAALTLAE